MHILTPENVPYSLDKVPDYPVLESGEQEPEELNFCILDFTVPDVVDFYFLPLVFLESFHAPAICLNIAGRNIQMPLDWSLLITDEELSGVEIMPLIKLTNRGVHALMMNPVTDIMPRSAEIHVTNLFQDVKWYFPKLKNGHILTVPLEDKLNPKCAFFVKDTTKIPNIIDVADLF